MMKNLRIIALLAIVLPGASGPAAAEDLQSFCSKTCSLWPKLCATGTACMNLCKVPQRLMKACRNKKVPIDTSVPDIPFTKPQFCTSICNPYPLMCSAMTYCTQSCGTPPEKLKQCIQDGKRVDTVRPNITG